VPIRTEIETLFTAHVAEFTNHADFVALASRQASPRDYARFIENVVRSHLKSPQLLAFLFALAPPRVAENLQHNLLEELGIEEDSGIAHPSLLRQLAVGAGLAHRLPELEALAAADLRQLVSDPLLYGTLKEVGLAALCEVTAFEFMLSRVAGRIARALAAHCGLGPATLEWFTHHAEVDTQHAEQGLDNLAAYIRYYEFSEEDALTTIEMTLRENVFIKRYFGELARADTSMGGQS
jgi:Iron-containing redox enzyme